MALIGTLRDKMGTWVVVFVFVAIAAFVLGDIFSGNSNILNWGKNTVGEIGGKEITYEEYLAVVQEREASFYLSNGYEPSEREMPSIRQQAWDLLIARHAIVPQFEKVGVTVTDREVEDMISGKNVFDGIKQSFVNQETGQFDRAQLGSYLNQLKTMPEGSEPRVRWQMFQKDLRPARERIKYENLLLKTSYVTKAEAEKDYHAQSDVAEVKYVFVPYFAVSDSIQVSDAAVSEYYNKNKERFKTEGTRDMKYVSFEVIPSSEDSLEVKQALSRAVEEFKTAQNDSLYASTNSEGEVPFGTYNAGNLPAYIPQDQLTEGNVIGPVQDGNTYRVAKVTRIFNDTTFAARAKHILIRPVDASEPAKAEAKVKAQGILKDIKGGADFAAKAREFGTDGTAQRGGDLGWFSSGQMVKPFETAVFNASKKGVLADVVETDFGFHIIEVTEVKTNKAYKIAVVEQEITPSEVTVNEAFRKAETFAAGLSGTDEFQKRAKAEGLTVLEAKNITPSDRRVGTVGEARTVVMWLYRDASKGEVSPVFDLENQNVVAVMTNEIKEGYKPLEVVKEEILPAVRNEAKGKIIIEKLKNSKGTLEEIAQSYGSDANVYSSSDLKLGAFSLPSVGYDPKVVGLAFSLENGKRSEPIAGENGVVIMEVQNKTVAPEQNDYTAYKTQIQQNATNSSSMNIAEAIRQNSDIEDKRFKFF